MRELIRVNDERVKTIEYGKEILDLFSFRSFQLHSIFFLLLKIF